MITWVGVGVTGSSCAFTLSTPQMSRISWNKQITKSKSFVSKLFDTILKELSNDLCSENGFRDFEELSGYSHHRCKVLVIPGVDYQGQDDDSFFLWWFYDEFKMMPMMSSRPCHSFSEPPRAALAPSAFSIWPQMSDKVHMIISDFAKVGHF